MRLKTILSIAALFAIGLVYGAEGDTIKIQSHQETHWDWNGNWYDTTAFPDTGSYRRILMYYTLGCPSIGCSEWDYTTKIEVGDPVNDSTTRWVELTRIITPYAGDKNANWKHQWVIDVTDYAPILKGERVVRAHYGGWQNGFTVSIDFDFIEGVPAREVLDVTSLYDGTFRYGFTNDPIEDHLVPTDISMHADLASAKFRMVASGHSFGGNENCAEFCQKWYKLNVDGVKAVQEDVWRDDCGSNALQGQTGTWIYNRAGWCPGDETQRYDTEIGHLVSAGSTHEFNVDWENYTYTGGAGFDPQYIIEATIFQYGDWAFSNDLAIDRVIRPSMDDRLWELNPICNNPEIVITNTGSENVTRATIEYWVEGSPEVIRHEFKGLLLPGMSEQIVLPSYDKWLFGEKTVNVFHARVASVNNEDDQYAGNNHITSRFMDTEVYPEQFIIAFNNNNAGAETKYKVVSERGDIVFERTTATSNAQYLDTVTLDPGCYTLIITDQGCDGLSFFANNDGNGRIWLHPAEEGEFYPPLHQFDPEFGCEAMLSFTVGYTMGDEETMEYPTGLNEATTSGELRAVPNPASDVVTLMLLGDLERGGRLSIYNQTGQLVAEDIVSAMNGAEFSGLANGNYIARYVSASAVVTTIFVIVH
jgi:hypothetical protein